jgi:hypothetical protein
MEKYHSDGSSRTRKQFQLLSTEQLYYGSEPKTCGRTGVSWSLSPQKQRTDKVKYPKLSMDVYAMPFLNPMREAMLQSFRIKGIIGTPFETNHCTRQNGSSSCLP